GGLIGASVIIAGAGGWWTGLVLQWWAGDGIAVLVVGGPILLWARRRPLVSARWRQMLLLVAVTAGLAGVAFPVSPPSVILVLPVLGGAGFWVGDLAVVFAGTAFAVVANYLTAAGYGEFAHLGLSSPASLAIAQVYIAVLVLICWLLAQEVSGRIRAIGERESARLQRQIADARRMAAELGDSLADANPVGRVAERVSGAVRGRLGALRVVVDVPGDLPEREPENGSGSVEESVATLPLPGASGALGYLNVQWPAPHEISAAEREYLQ